MQIIDLTAEHETDYFRCLEEWSEDMKEAGSQRQNWYTEMAAKGLRVKLALTDDGVVAGFIQYLPVSESNLLGKEGYFICCIWVHGYKQGRGDLRHKGLGNALLAAAEQDAKALGATGISAWGLILPFWMKASWYKKHGYKSVDRDGLASLVWKPFMANALPPKWRRPVKKPLSGTYKLRISIFCSGWCSAQNIAMERIKRISAEFSDKVILEEYNTRNKAVLNEWGISDAIFLDAKQINTGPPPSYDKLKNLVIKTLKQKFG